MGEVSGIASALTNIGSVISTITTFITSNAIILHQT